MLKELNKITETVIGAAMAVHRELGPGLLESAYEACLAYELAQNGLAWVYKNNSSAVSAISAVKDEKPLAVHPTSGLAFPKAACVVALIRGDHDTNCNTYRCFLPDLTGFVSVCCAVSDQHQPQTGPGPTNTLHGGFNPA